MFLLKQIDPGYAFVYGVNSANDIFTRPVDGSGSWHQITGKLKHITSSKNKSFGVNVQNQVLLEIMHWKLGEGGGSTVTV